MDNVDERLLVTRPPVALDQPVSDIPDVGQASVPAIAGRSWQWPANRLSSLPGSVARASELEVSRGAMFLLVPVFLAAGSLAYFAWPTEPTWTLLGAWLSGVALFAVLFRHRRTSRLIALMSLVLLAGAIAAKIEVTRSETKMLGSEITTQLIGVVELVEPRENGRVRLTLRVVETERPKLRYQPERVRVTARSAPPGIKPGDIIEGVVRLSPPMGPLRPGSYDFAFEAWFDGIGANGFFLKDPIRSARQAEPSFFQNAAYVVENARIALADRIRLHMSGEAGEIAAALVAGVRAGIPEEANEALRITGLAHVLSISGLHMALVAGVVIFTMRTGFAFFPNFASRHPIRKYAAVGALVMLTVYLGISGMEVAAVRAYLMISVMLIALLFDQFALSMRNLAIAAIVILLISPHEAVGPSFQMSFAATATLIAAYAWWGQRAGRRTDMTPQRRGWVTTFGRAVLFGALGLMATSLVAGTATGIYGAWHFQRASPLGLLANLGAMPAVSAIVMPSAVFGVLLMPLGLEGPVFWMMGLGIDWMMAVARYLAARTPVDAIGTIPLSAVILLSIALIPLTVATTRHWRWMALPFLCLGFSSLATRQYPQIFVSEDAKMVGVRTVAGDMAVNRSRPNAFRAEDWQRAMNAGEIVKPVNDAAGNDVQLRSDRFSCRDGVCAISQEGARPIAHATNMQAASRACGWAALIIIEDPTAANPCPGIDTVVLTARRLALEGSAEIRINGPVVTVRTALEEMERPWHDHRRFSRAARGLGPYQRKERPDVRGSPPNDQQGQADALEPTTP